MVPVNAVEKGTLSEIIRPVELNSREVGEELNVLEDGDAARDGRVKTPELLLNLCLAILGIWRGTLGKFLCVRDGEEN